MISFLDKKICFNKNNSGFALLAVFFMLTVLASMFAAYMILTQTEINLVKASKDSASGFNAAEAGLNIRANEIRETFLDFARPAGVSPGGVEDCDSGTLGSGDFACETFSFANKHTALTYITEEAGNPIQTVIPPGEPFAGLSTQEYRYTVTSIGRNTSQSNEAILELTFKSRLVPLYQFAIFFNDDMEFFNGAVMTVDGPVHSNNNMYLAAQSGDLLKLDGQVTVGGQLYRGKKDASSCSGYGGTVSILNPTTYVNTPSCSTSRTEITDASAWNDNLLIGVNQVDLPSVEDIESFSDSEFWKRADLRLALRLNSSNQPDTTNSATGIEVVDADGINIPAATAALDNATNCPGSISTASGPNKAVGTQGPSTSGNQLRQYREYQYSSSANNFQRTLEVDVEALLNCIYLNPSIMDGKTLDDDTEGGLVFFLAIDGPDRMANHNNYAVRIRNGDRLQSNISGADTVRGLTIVTDQGMNIWGDYNTSNWIPASLVSDSLYLLSNNWSDADSYQTDRYYRDGNATEVQAAVLTGVKITGGVNGSGGENGGTTTAGGGAINVFRFNQYFRTSSGQPDFTYVGSIVSLGEPRHSQSSWGPFTYYSAPNRVWSYDERFNDPNNLPPMTPSFVYLRQEVFVRNFEF